MSANPVQAIIDHYERGEVEQSHRQLDQIAASYKLDIAQSFNMLQLAYHIGHLELVGQVAKQAIQQFPGEYKLYVFLKRYQLETFRLHEAYQTVCTAQKHPHYELNKPLIDSTFLQLHAYVNGMKCAAENPKAAIRFPLDELPNPKQSEPLDVVITERAGQYVKYYKYNQKAGFEAAYTHQPHKDVDFDLHSFIHFFCTYHINDYGDMFMYMPTSAKSVLNIGGGIGMSEMLYRHHYGHDCHFSLIELAEMTHVEHHDSEAHPTQKLDKPLRLVEEANDFLKANGFRDDQLTLCSSDDVSALEGQEFDLVTSSRSWMFLYPMETYWDLVKSTLKPEGVLIADVNPQTGDLEKLRQAFGSVQEINGNDALKRVVCRKIKP
ncbi:MAG: hypothetical protein MRY32_09455 [Rickettsiales bacterium]|nr:hypothetical protein [Rickettsiales bacterium]